MLGRSPRIWEDPRPRLHVRSPLTAGGRITGRQARAPPPSPRSHSILATLCGRPILRETVTAKLHEQRPPQQISAWFRREYPDYPQTWVSQETIYHCLDIRHERYLTTVCFTRCAQIARFVDREDGNTPTGVDGWNVFSIDECSADADTRSSPGHWRAISCSRPAVGDCDGPTHTLARSSQLETL